MSPVDLLFSSARIRKAIWRLWYPFVTRRLRADDVLFLNYAFETNPPLALPLAPADEPDRACIQLYHHVAGQVDLRGQRVLEVSCGHGGGASYLTRTVQPSHYTGLDLNPTGIAFCKKRHPVPGLSFIQGDAQALPFGDEMFDVVINVEASHCYPSFAQFLREAARVLRPGGHLLYADFRFNSAIATWESAMASAPLVLRQWREINAEVLRGMTLNSARSARLIDAHLPSFLRPLGRDFAGVQGSRIYIALQRNELSYRSYRFEKPKLAGGLQASIEAR